MPCPGLIHERTFSKLPLASTTRRRKEANLVYYPQTESGPISPLEPFLVTQYALHSQSHTRRCRKFVRNGGLVPITDNGSGWNGFGALDKTHVWRQLYFVVESLCCYYSPDADVNCPSHPLAMKNPKSELRVQFHLKELVQGITVIIH